LGQGEIYHRGIQIELYTDPQGRNQYHTT